MLTAGLTVLVVGIGAAMGGLFGIKVFRDSQHQPPSSISGGAFVGAVWAYRLGLGVAIVGAFLLGVAGLVGLVD